MNRLSAVTSSAEAKNSQVGASTRSSAPVPRPSPKRARLPKYSTWRRRQRSSSTPANGPITENGSSITASTEAMSAGEDCFSGEKTT